MLEGLALPDSDKVVLEDSVKKRTGAELQDRVFRIARLLQDHFGLQPGDHAAMVVGNRVEFIEITLAAICAGLWLTPVNWHLTRDEIDYICDDSGAKVLLIDPAFEASCPRGTADRPLVSLGTAFEALIASASDRPFEFADPAGGLMPYTSGTTGRPKGVKRFVRPRLGDQLQSLVVGGKELGLDGIGTHLVTGPMYHAAPGGFALRDLLAGAAIVIMPRWDEGESLRLMMEHCVTHTHMVPTMFTRLLRLPDQVRQNFDSSSLLTVLHGAAPISVSLKRKIIDWWGPVLVEYWGASEGGVVTLVNSQLWLERPGTVGRAIPDHEVFATDEDGQRLPPGETGLLWAHNTRVDTVFEYHGAPEKTAAAFCGPGTYTLGDVGSVDSEGFVYLTDRLTEMIISGGVNIYPAEVEAVLAGHPAVGDVAVFGVPNDEWGESVRAVVELAEGFEASPELADLILAYGKEHLAGFKMPRSLHFEDELPRSPSGKLLKSVLRDRHRADRERSI